MNNENETILEETNDKRVTTTELLKFSDRYGTDEEYGMSRYHATLALLRHQYKSKYTAWIIDELIQEDDELWEYLTKKELERMGNAHLTKKKLERIENG